jgi:XTP/dITP diphosphohydrolase/tetrapyrrole methylase family protein/MazG family protein
VFDLDAVAREVNEKLVRRHPHVFGDEARIGTSGDVLVKWEQIKAQEKKNGPAQSGLFKEQPPRLPATMYAESIWKQIEKKSLPVGDTADVPTIRTLGAELDDAELGRRLFELCAAARAKGLDPEGALRRHADAVKAAVEAHAQASA